MTITTALASAIPGIVFYAVRFWTVQTTVASVAARLREARLPAATAGIHLIHERREYRRMEVQMCLTFATVSS